MLYAHGCKTCLHYYRCVKVMEVIEDSFQKYKNGIDSYIYQSYNKMDFNTVNSCRGFDGMRHIREGELIFYLDVLELHDE